VRHGGEIAGTPGLVNASRMQATHHAGWRNSALANKIKILTF
jgi:hypothetical protein